MYQVHQLERNVSDSLNLLCLGHETKVRCYNGYFIDKYVFYIEEYSQSRKIYNSKVYIKRLISNEFEVDYYRKLEEVIKEQYHNELNKVCLFK
jgi:hypothetical protein